MSIFIFLPQRKGGGRAYAEFTNKYFFFAKSPVHFFSALTFVSAEN